MNREKLINQEVEKTLQSLDDLSRARANPFLFTRIKSRMERSNGWDRFTSFLSRPAVALAMVILVLLINVLVLTNTGNSQAPETETIAVSDMADEYTLAVSGEYDY